MVPERKKNDTFYLTILLSTLLIRLISATLLQNLTLILTTVSLPCGDQPSVTTRPKLSGIPIHTGTSGPHKDINTCLSHTGLYPRLRTLEVPILYDEVPAGSYLCHLVSACQSTFPPQSVHCVCTSSPPQYTTHTGCNGMHSRFCADTRHVLS